MYVVSMTTIQHANARDAVGVTGHVPLSCAPAMVIVVHPHRHPITLDGMMHRRLAHIHAGACLLLQCCLELLMVMMVVTKKSGLAVVVVVVLIVVLIVLLVEKVLPQSDGAWPLGAVAVVAVWAVATVLTSTSKMLLLWRVVLLLWNLQQSLALSLSLSLPMLMSMLMQQVLPTPAAMTEAEWHSIRHE
jgi:hypothetical protein